MQACPSAGCGSRKSAKMLDAFGNDAWTAKMAARLGLEYTVNPRGSTKKRGGEKS
jgi:hypothetical protein